MNDFLTQHLESPDFSHFFFYTQSDEVTIKAKRLYVKFILVLFLFFSNVFKKLCACLFLDQISRCILSVFYLPFFPTPPPFSHTQPTPTFHLLRVCINPNLSLSHVIKKPVFVMADLAIICFYKGLKLKETKSLNHYKSLHSGFPNLHFIKLFCSQT